MMSFGPLPLLVLLASLAMCSSDARCPPGWWLPMGVTDRGWYVCKPIAPMHEGVSPRGGYRDESVEPVGELHGRVYCTSGTRPVVVEGVAVACMHGGWL